MSKNKLSHSSAAIFQTCPTKWKYHYLERLRPVTQSAALLFGTAVDAAFTSILKGKEKNPKDVFAFFWRFQEVNGVKTYLTTCPDIVYANNDYDADLLDEDDINKLKQEYQLADPVVYIDEIYKEKDVVGFENLSIEKRKILNHANWLCLYHKGILFIDAFNKNVLPNITEVLGSQVYVKLDNEEGDSVIGYADAVVRWKGLEKPVVLDFKTSSKEYERDAVLTSPQLTLYVHDLSEKYEQTRNAGFVVFSKKIRKNKTKRCSKCGNDGTGKRHRTCDAIVNNERCNAEWIEKINPEVFVQILINEIPWQTESIVLDNMDYINEAIKNGVFHRNFNSCVQPWGKCAYYDKCYHGKDDGLVKLEDKAKDEKKRND